MLASGGGAFRGWCRLRVNLLQRLVQATHDRGDSTGLKAWEDEQSWTWILTKRFSHAAMPEAQKAILLHHGPALWGKACPPVLHAAQRCVGHLRDEGLQLAPASSPEPGVQAFCLCRGDAVACQPLCRSLQAWAWVTHCSWRIGVLAAAQGPPNDVASALRTGAHWQAQLGPASSAGDGRR